MYTNFSSQIISNSRNSTLTYIEIGLLTTIENVGDKSNKSIPTHVGILRTGYIFSFVIVFLIVLFGIVSRVIYSSSEPPIGLVYKKYQRAFSLPADYRCQVESDGNKRKGSASIDINSEKESNRKKSKDNIQLIFMNK